MTEKWDEEAVNKALGYLPKNADTASHILFLTTYLKGAQPQPADVCSKAGRDDIDELIEDYSTNFGWELKELGWYRVHKNDIKKGLEAFARDLKALRPEPVEDVHAVNVGHELCSKTEQKCTEDGWHNLKDKRPSESGYYPIYTTRLRADYYDADANFWEQHQGHVIYWYEGLPKPPARSD